MSARPSSRHLLDLLDRAEQACRERDSWSPWPETPAAYPDGAQAQARARMDFAAQCGQAFVIDGHPGAIGAPSEEVSPYTQRRLAIRYPQSDPDTLFAAAEAAQPAWAAADADTRLAVLMEVVDELYRLRIFDIATAMMHTAGQSANMAYTGSGVNALDRAIEALVHARAALRAVTPRGRWERSFGSARIALDKTWRATPRGVAVCFTCATFATWNAWPSMMASLATGNAVIVKPHPTSVLPMAHTVLSFRQVLARAGFSPDLVTMLTDTTAEPVGEILVRHAKTAIVDFTGSARFGQWVERNAHPALVFTETSGVNTVVIESAADLDAVLRSLATTLSMFSAQMCTSPQNIYLPRAGVRTPQGTVPLDEVAQRLAAAIDAIGSDPRRAGMILAAIQSPTTLTQLAWLRDEGARVGRVLLEPRPYRHPEFPDARTSTPLLVQTDTSQRALYGEERFGPAAFVIACADGDDALAQACADIRAFGGLTAFVYSQDETFIAEAETRHARAGAQLTINLVGPMPLNFAAAYSDVHVTGLNPAGNASLTDLAFVAGRFRITQSRRPADPASGARE